MTNNKRDLLLIILLFLFAISTFCIVDEYLSGDNYQPTQTHLGDSKEQISYL